MPATAMSRALAFSASSSRRVFVSISGSLQRNGVQRRGRSSFPSASLRPEKGKRPSKQERVVLVKSFVDKYRASNAGKFPSVSLVRQEVGGSYYTLRHIVQEMEYNHKFSQSKNEALLTDKVDGIKDQSFEQIKMPKVEECGAQSHEPFQTAEVVKDQSSNVEVEVEHKRTSKSEVEAALWHPSGKDVSRTIKDTIVKHSRDRQSADTITSDIDENQRNRASEAGMSSVYVKQEKVVSELASGQEILFPSKTEDFQCTKMELSDQNSELKEELLRRDGDVWKFDVKTEDKPTVNLRSGIQDTLEYSSRQTVDEMLENSNPKHPSDKYGLRNSAQTANDRFSDVAEQKSGHQRRDQDEVSPRTSNLWRNLKSFADGIFGFWKKL